MTNLSNQPSPNQPLAQPLPDLASSQLSGSPTVEPSSSQLTAQPSLTQPISQTLPNPSLVQPQKLNFKWEISLFELIALVSTIITLVFLTKQVKDQSVATEAQTQALQSSTYQGLMDKQMQLDQIFIEHPEVRPYIFNKKSIEKNDKNYNRVMAVVDYQLDFFQMVSSQSNFLPELKVDSSARNSWDGYMKATFEDNSSLCKRLYEAKEAYDSEFVKMVKDKKWCR
jgi:hypothetical protein